MLDTDQLIESYNNSKVSTDFCLTHVMGFIFFSLAHMGDGKLDDEEIGKVQQLFFKHNILDFSDEKMWNVYNDAVEWYFRVLNDSDDASEFIDTLKGCINGIGIVYDAAFEDYDGSVDSSHAKSQYVNDLVQIAKADGKIDPGEIQMIKNVCSMFNVPVPDSLFE